MHATISESIELDLLQRIGLPSGLPVSLTLDALALHYGVSHSPVRKAIRNLIDKRILIKETNGRVRVDPTSLTRREKNSRQTPFALPKRSQEIESELAVEIIRASLLGEEFFLREESTANRFGVGRTVIRQVLGRLAGRGLITHVPRRGWRVRGFVEADLDAYLEVREQLELKALELARPRLIRSELRRLLAANSPPQLDNNLHRYLITKCNNLYIQEFFERYGAYYSTLFDFAAPETSHVEEMAGQHRAILKALIDEDWVRARRELASHIRAQCPIVKSLIRKIVRTKGTNSQPGAA